MSEAPYRWGVIETRFSTFAAAVDDEKRLVCFWLHAKKGNTFYPRGIHDEKAIGDVRRQVMEYCKGTRRAFEIEWKAKGSPFQLEVWNALYEIPYGETTSYGALAKKLGYPKGARAVGLANGQNPIPLIVPCHRVIGSDGSLTGFGGGLPLKRALLAHEATFGGRKGDLFG